MATLTLRNVPEALVARLKERAKRHRRSLNSETIAALELVEAATEPGQAEAFSEPTRWDRQAALARIRQIQARFPGASPTIPQPPEATALLAALRGRFHGPPLSPDELVAAIERDGHPHPGTTL
jgi:plasmid stability protein